MTFYHVGFHSTRIRKVKAERETQHTVWIDGIPWRKRARWWRICKTRQEAIEQLFEWGQ